MLQIIPSRCKGCRICEVICSFHHSGRKFFSPNISSTTVLRNGDTGQIKIDLNNTCDLCEGEETVLCVKYCVYGARELTLHE